MLGYIKIGEDFNIENIDKLPKLMFCLGYDAVLVDITASEDKFGAVDSIEHIDVSNVGGKKSILVPLCAMNISKDCREILGRAIISFKVTNQKEFVLGLRNRDVALIEASIEEIAEFFNRNLYNLSLQYHKFIGVDISSMIHYSKPSQVIKIIRNLKRKLVLYMNKRKGKFIVYSAASNLSEIITMYQLKAILSLVDVKDFAIKRILKENTDTLVTMPYEFLDPSKMFWVPQYLRKTRNS